MSRLEARGEELLRTLDLVREALRGLRFGTIELQVHDAQVVRVTRTEKVRVEAAREEQQPKKLRELP
jgi:hypothetical protein